MLTLLIAVLITALVFDYINGFHDAANAIATSVSTGVLPLRTAVLIAGAFNFIGAMAGTAVASFIAKGLAEPAQVTQLVVLAALIGAIAWNLITWWYGIPSSSSHALIGGVMGAVVAHGGVGAFKWPSLWQKVLLPLIASPLLGFVLALVLMIALIWIVHRMRPGPVNRASRKLQLLSACGMAFSHGSNDAQKSMGIMTLAITAYVAGHGAESLPQWMQSAHPAWTQAARETILSWPAWLHWLDHVLPAPDAKIPLWVVVGCATAIGLGTAAGGKRIIKTMGAKIIRITPLQGFAAETSGSATILVASFLGVPVSTTHVINACIMGVGASKRLSAVRWGVATNIVLAWVLTLPASGAIAWLTMKGLALVE